MTNKDKKGKKNVRGFTLIEILIAAAIMVILAVAFLGIQYILSENQTSAWKNYLSIENANAAMAVLTKELRSATLSSTGSYPLEIANDQEIVFYSDYDFDGVVERIRYTLTGSQLLKGIVEPTGNPLTYDLGAEIQKTMTEIARNGASPVFYYYNSDWPTDTVNNPLAAASRISDTREVKIVLRTNPDPNNSNFDYILESNVKIRMLFQP